MSDDAIDNKFRKQIEELRRREARLRRVFGVSKPGITSEVLDEHQNRSDSLARMHKGQEVARERLTALLGDDLQLTDPVAAEAFRRVTGVLGALLGVEVDDGQG